MPKLRTLGLQAGEHVCPKCGGLAIDRECTVCGAEFPEGTVRGAMYDLIADGLLIDTGERQGGQVLWNVCNKARN
jgi:hypothetical protein